MLLLKKDLESQEYEILAKYAMKSAETEGRDNPISPDNFRTEFQRDRDRIVHCAAFRKLEYKTQVFVIYEGDYYRSRLTHTLEVAQISRTLAQNLLLNPSLAEAIALAHDIGHTPFGHSGQRALNLLMKSEGGFEHNEQGLRVVEHLEEKYSDSRGLNLTWEVREGIIKHATDYDRGRIEERFALHKAPTLEAQIVDVADEIAYNNHDLDDAMKMGLIEEKDLRQVDWCREIFAAARKASPHGVRDKFVKYRAIGMIIDMQVRDVLEQTQNNIDQYGVDRVDKVRNLGKRIATFSPDMVCKNKQLKQFLMEHVYQHPNTVRMSQKAESFIHALFNLYQKSPKQLPYKYQERIQAEGATRVICDYISGMTDRFLQQEYVKAFEPQMVI